MIQGFQKIVENILILLAHKSNHAVIPFWKLTMDQWENKDDKNIEL